MLVINARIRGKAEKRSQLLSLFHDLVTLSREEDGCLSYRFYEDMENENQFLIVEEWESQEFLNQHHQTAHFLSFKQQVGEFVAETPEVKVHDVASTYLE